MSDSRRRDRGALFALGFVLGAVVLLGLIQRLGADYQPVAYAPEEHAETYQNATPAATDAKWGKERDGSAATYQALCNSPENSSDANLCQQWRSAENGLQQIDLARQQLLATSFEIGALLVTIVVGIVAAWAAFRSIAVAGKYSQDQMRAYVAVSSVSVRSRASANPEIILHLENTGQTPATFVAISARVSRIVEADLPVAVVGEASGYDTIGPLGASTVNEEYSVSRVASYGDELARFIRSAEVGTVLAVFGTVRYGTIFDEIYESEYLFYFPNIRDGGEAGKSRRAPAMFLRTYRKLGKGE